MSNKSAIVLLSGGLDSVVSLAWLKDKSIDIKRALTFNYGQKSFQKEAFASERIAEYYNVEHEIIELNWLKNITTTSLVSGDIVPKIDESDLDNINLTQNTMKSVWVPNRNGLFINIAAAYCDAQSVDYIVIGANKEEAATFSDNSEQFVADINKSLELSTNYNVSVIAPLISMNKTEIVEQAVKLEVPLALINSCYNSTEKHCGECESCNRLKRALIESGQNDIFNKLFE